MEFLRSALAPKSSVAMISLCSFLLTSACEKLVKKKSDGEEVKGEERSIADVAASSQVLAGRFFWDANNNRIAGTMINRGALNASTQMASGFYDGSIINAPEPLTIAKNQTILGVTGALPVLASNVSRDSIASQIAQYAETSTYAGGDLPSNHRDIPDITKDDEAYNGAACAYVNRPGSLCGMNGTMAARISDCSEKNVGASKWDGGLLCNGGQGSWTLVSRAGANKEVWQDDRTGLLWSSVVGSDNWCRAAGNTQANDPSGYCNNSAYQNPSAPTSYCAEGTGLISAIAGENWGAGVYGSAKGALGKNSVPAVRWRLPTASDYHQAEVNGLRFVLPDAGYNGGSFEWTATVASNAKASAWTYQSSYGQVGSNFRLNSQSIRCVGR